MSILISGNKGFIGSGLKGDGIDLKDSVDIVTYKAKKKYNVVIHTAAMTSVTESLKMPDEYIRTNIVGTLNMIEQHPEAHFIYLSTCAVYGQGRRHSVNSKLNPESIYASTKLAGEFLVRNLCKSWVILRLTNVIGSGLRGEPNVYQVFEKADILPVFGDGLQTRDFIHVDKVREIIMNCIDRKGIFNIGSGISKTVLEIAKEFKKPIRFLPERVGEIKHFGVKDAIDHPSKLG